MSRPNHPLLDTLNESFFGGNLKQRFEQGGHLVEFAGHVLFDWQGGLGTRTCNPQVTYSATSPDQWHHTQFRFASGREYLDRRSQLGRVFGHLSRTPDHSNKHSIVFVFFDLLWLFLELKTSGWGASVFRQALHRVLLASPGLSTVIEQLEMVLGWLE